MAPKAVSVSKKAIEQYDTDHIMSREKKIITDELIREHKRAESLAKAIENITKTFKEIDVIAKKTGADAETDSVAKLRLSKDVTDMMAKIYGLKIDDLKGLLEPKKVTIETADDDLLDTKVNEDQDNTKLNDTLKQKHTNWFQIQRFSVALVVNDFHNGFL